MMELSNKDLQKAIDTAWLNCRIAESSAGGQFWLDHLKLLVEEQTFRCHNIAH